MTSESPPISQECVEGYLYRTHPLRFLILRRPPSRGSIWVPVSGKVDPSDRDYRGALARELEEETGVRAPLRVFPLGWEVVFEHSPGAFWRLHAFGVELPSELAPTLSDEHDGFEWVSAHEAVRRLHYEDNREAVRRLERMLGSASP